MCLPLHFRHGTRPSQEYLKVLGMTDTLLDYCRFTLLLIVGWLLIGVRLMLSDTSRDWGVLVLVTALAAFIGCCLVSSNFQCPFPTLHCPFSILVCFVLISAIVFVSNQVRADLALLDNRSLSPWNSGNGTN